MSVFRVRAAYAWTKDSVRLISTPSPFARSALFYVQEVGHFRTLPGYFTEREQLDSYLIVYTVAGKGRLLYRGRAYTLRPGQAFWIDCLDYQHYVTDPEDLWEILWVHANGGSIRPYYELFASLGDPVVSLPRDSTVPALIRQLVHLHRRKNARIELISSKCLVELVTDLLLAAQEAKNPASAMPDYLERVVAALEQRYAEKITLDELAAQCSVSKYHLAREFKKYTGFSPGEYLLNIRITKAKEWLRYTDMTVTEIAERVGIPHVSHFINLFRARAELTPLAYRKKWQRPR
jgi:AraC-like DNA-binding protein